MAGPLPAEYTPVRPSPSHIFKQLRSVARPIRQAGGQTTISDDAQAAAEFWVASAVYPRAAITACSVSSETMPPCSRGIRA